MKGIFNNKLLKYLVCVMVIVQGFLFSLVVTFYMDLNYFHELNSQPVSSLYIKLKTIPEGKADETFRFLKAYSVEKGIFYMRKDHLLDREGNLNGIIFGIDGDLSKNKDKLNFEFLGQSIINGDKLKKLLDSKENDATLGIQETSLKKIDTIPRFRYGKNIVFKKLESVVKETKTINGEYRIVGLEKSQQADFLKRLSEVSGVDSKVFFDGKSGYNIDDSFKEMTVVGIFIIHSMVLLALMVVITIRSLPNLGKFMLQGWSRYAFAVKLYQPMLYTGFISTILFILYGMFLTNVTFNSITFYSVMLGLGLLNFIIILLILSVSSVFIFLVSPIAAIRERFPKRVYMLTALAVYIVFNLMLIGVSSYIDGPYREIEKNIDISNKWSQVSEYKILRKVSIGEDQASFNRQSKELFKDFYNWYKSISEDKDVSIVNTSYISKDLLNSYKNDKVYEHVPNEAFWVFTVSPNYLKKMGINVDKSVVEKAKSGTRVYLIPEDKTDEESRLLREMLKENDTRSIRQDDISTIFNKKQEFKFIKYNSEKGMFSWNTKSLNNLMIKKPIILISTPNNMTFRESEGLIAIGLEDSYVKLEGKALEKYANSEYLSKFNLDDNEIEFASVKSFVDGVQKTLWTTVQLFFGLMAAITFIVVVLLITIILIFQNSYREKIFIKKFLGYSNFNIYKLPIFIISLIVAFDMISVILLKSKIGVVYIFLVSILQLILFYKVVSSNQMKKLSVFLKS